jgi:predicted RNase H-like nuclease
VSRQAFGIFRQVEEVDQIMTPTLQRRIAEAHPELAFGSVNGRIPVHNKHTTEGINERISRLSYLAPLAVKGIKSIVANIRNSYPKMVCGDDILDAMILAWVAARIRWRQAYRIPAKPVLDEKGLRMEIWF